ncbi:MAG: ABC transporter permease [Rhizobiales bacterium]|nr:ABC transporter permease [Hyphomicrobiales bacterium]NRB14343.1 ABC transporter permease [Hyphomicrobiales bacterium]
MTNSNTTQPETKKTNSSVETTGTLPVARNPLYYAWRRFIANRGAVVAGSILSIIILMAIVAPYITPTSYEEQKFLSENLGFPSWEHWFGVDDLGRDFYARIVYGARISLSIGFIAATFSVFIGLPLGALSGYYGGSVDWFVMRIVEIFSVVPPLMAALLLAALTDGGFLSIVAIAALFGWVQVCLLVRGQVMALRNTEFIRAAKALGGSHQYVIFKHLIPNSISPVIVGFVQAIPLAMMLEAGLSFLGVGIAPPLPSWGQMINIGINFMFFYWHLALFPTLALAITVLSTTLFGDGLRDALDPTLKG